VRGMAEASLSAIMKDAPTKPKMEEFAVNMGQRGPKRRAATKDAPTKQKRDESVSGTVQSIIKNADMKDATTKSKTEESAEGMELS